MAYKYLYKYVYKGPDMAVVTLEMDGDEQTVDEIKRYIDGRYISASEAFWRFFRFSMHEEWPNVMPLSVHLPGGQVRFLSII